MAEEKIEVEILTTFDAGAYGEGMKDLTDGINTATNAAAELSNAITAASIVVTSFSINPILGAIASVGALGYAMYELGDFNAAATTTTELADALITLNGASDLVATNHAENIEKINAKSLEVDETISALEGRIALPVKTDTDKTWIREYVDDLNSALPGLGLAFDEATGTLNTGFEEISKYNDKFTEESKLNAEFMNFDALNASRDALQANCDAAKTNLEDLQTSLDDAKRLEMSLAISELLAALV